MKQRSKTLTLILLKKYISVTHCWYTVGRHGSGGNNILFVIKWLSELQNGAHLKILHFLFMIITFVSPIPT